VPCNEPARGRIDPLGAARTAGAFNAAAAIAILRVPFTGKRGRGEGEGEGEEELSESMTNIKDHRDVKETWRH
jgi:hypothetical protein